MHRQTAGDHREMDMRGIHARQSQTVDVASVPLEGVEFGTKGSEARQEPDVPVPGIVEESIELPIE